MLGTTDDARASTQPPLVVDLDGTLIKSDLFIEAMIRYVGANPLRIFALVGWLLKGRAYAKARLAEVSPCDPETLPYDVRVVTWLREEKAKGRVVALATASHRSQAELVATHLGVFDHVHATDGAINLKSSAKGARLSEVYPHGFVYAGNEVSDYPVWRSARGAVVVNASPGILAKARRSTPIEREFPREIETLRSLIKAMRPQQWMKNVLVFLPLLVGQAWFDPQRWLDATLTFVALSLAASSLYLVNDIADIDADRRHVRKRNRPFASGALSPAVGLAFSVLLLVSGLSVAYAAHVTILVALYATISAFYTFVLKRRALLDVFTLAGLYTLRVLIGGVAAAVYASGWLLAFCCFFFLSLALVKRVAETDAAQVRGGGEVIARRGYLSTDGQILKSMGVAAAFVSTLILALYLQDPSRAAQYRSPECLWVLPAVILFWLCRVWIKTERGEMHDDPIVFAFRDSASYVLGAVVVVSFAAAALWPSGWSWAMH